MSAMAAEDPFMKNHLVESSAEHTDAPKQPLDKC